MLKELPKEVLIEQLLLARVSLALAEPSIGFLTHFQQQAVITTPSGEPSQQQDLHQTDYGTPVEQVNPGIGRGNHGQWTKPQEGNSQGDSIGNSGEYVTHRNPSGSSVFGPTLTKPPSRPASLGGQEYTAQQSSWETAGDAQGGAWVGSSGAQDKNGQNHSWDAAGSAQDNNGQDYSRNAAGSAQDDNGQNHSWDAARYSSGNEWVGGGEAQESSGIGNREGGSQYTVPGGWAGDHKDSWAIGGEQNGETMGIDSGGNNNDGQWNGNTGTGSQHNAEGYEDGAERQGAGLAPNEILW